MVYAKGGGTGTSVRSNSINDKLSCRLKTVFFLRYLSIPRKKIEYISCYHGYVATDETI